MHIDIDRGLRESNSITRAITAENNNRFFEMLTSIKERLDVVLLVRGRASRTRFVGRNAKLGRQSLNSSIIVARNYMYRDATLLQGLDCPRSIRSKFIFKTIDRL